MAVWYTSAFALPTLARLSPNTSGRPVALAKSITVAQYPAVIVHSGVRWPHGHGVPRL